MRREGMIGIDLGGTNLRAARISEAGKILHRERFATRIDLGLPHLVDGLVTLCRSLSPPGPRILPVGIGIPGIIDADGTIQVSPNLPQLNGINLAKVLRDRLDAPVLAVNDAAAIAWGEARFGAGQDFASLITVTLGTGIGGGIILARRIWSGRDGYAGELGHLTVEPEGRSCGCGNRGCVETYASATGLVRSVREGLAAGGKSSLAEVPVADLTAQSVAEAARYGDLLAQSAIELAARKLGQALAAALNLLNPEALIITGGMGASLPLLQPYLLDELTRRSFVFARHPVPVLPGALGDDAGLLGVADLAAGVHCTIRNDPFQEEKHE